MLYASLVVLFAHVAPVVALSQSMSWQMLGSLRTDRHHHKARYIGDTKILVIGGYTRATGVMQGRPSASCEILDLRNKQIQYAASMAVERGVVNVAQAPDGTIYVVGGDTQDGPTDLVERYDVEADA